MLNVHIITHFNASIPEKNRIISQSKTWNAPKLHLSTLNWIRETQNPDTKNVTNFSRQHSIHFLYWQQAILQPKKHISLC